MLKISIKSGIITLLLIIIYSTLLVVAKNFIPVLPGMEFFILGGGIYLSHYFYKLEKGNMSFIQSIKLGVGVSSTVGLIFGIWFFIYSAFIDNNFIINIIKNVGPLLRQKGFDENSINIAVNQVSKNFTPIKLFLGISLTFTIAGLLLSLLIALVYKLRSLLSTKSNDN